MKHVLWKPHVTICFIWILPSFHLNYNTPQVLKVMKLNLFLILRNLWKVTSFHQLKFSVYSVTMTCSYSIKRLILHLTISTISRICSRAESYLYRSSELIYRAFNDTHVCEKQGQDDFLIHSIYLRHNFTLPQFMAQHNCEDLILQVHFQPLPKLPVVTPPIKFVLITQW